KVCCMDSLMERKDEKRIERERKKHKRTVVFTTVFAIFAVAVFAGYLINSLINREYTAYETATSIPRQDSDTVKYLPYKDGSILKYRWSLSNGYGRQCFVERQLRAQ
ncbi:MAG: hypothetical protein ACOCM8_10215, partial [Acetivibrio ethanolgignens]